MIIITACGQAANPAEKEQSDESVNDVVQEVGNQPAEDSEQDKASDPQGNGSEPETRPDELSQSEDIVPEENRDKPEPQPIEPPQSEDIVDEGSSPDENEGEPDPQPNEPPQAESIVVEIANFDFAPKELTLSAGSEITFVNKDEVKHTATVDGGFNSGLLSLDELFTIQLDDPGVYDIFCLPHPFMTMKITVD